MRVSSSIAADVATDCPRQPKFQWSLDEFFLSHFNTVPRQKSTPKRKKRTFCVSTLPTLLSSTISIIIPCIPLTLISNNKIFKKEFYLI